MTPFTFFLPIKASLLRETCPTKKPDATFIGLCLESQNNSQNLCFHGKQRKYNILLRVSVAKYAWGCFTRKRKGTMKASPLMTWLTLRGKRGDFLHPGCTGDPMAWSFNIWTNI